jgi:hypothetical protein
MRFEVLTAEELLARAATVYGDAWNTINFGGR